MTRQIFLPSDLELLSDWLAYPNVGGDFSPTALARAHEQISALRDDEKTIVLALIAFARGRFREAETTMNQFASDDPTLVYVQRSYFAMIIQREYAAIDFSSYCHDRAVSLFEQRRRFFDAASRRAYAEANLCNIFTDAYKSEATSHSQQSMSKSIDDMLGNISRLAWKNHELGMRRHHEPRHQVRVDIGAAMTEFGLGDLGPARRYLGRARSGYARVADGVGVGAALVLEGDWLLSPRGAEYLRQSLPEAEDIERLCLQTAVDRFARAQRLFLVHGAPRGVGATLLWNASLAGRVGQLQAGIHWAARAADVYLSCGDEAGYYRASIRRAIFEIVAEHEPTLGPLRTFAHWVADVGSVGFATEQCQLIHNLALRQYRVKTRPKVALGLLELGKSILGKGVPLARWLEIRLEPANIYSSLGQPLRALKVAHDVLTDLDALPEDDKPNMATRLEQRADIVLGMGQYALDTDNIQVLARTLDVLSEVIAEIEAELGPQRLAIHDPAQLAKLMVADMRTMHLFKARSVLEYQRRVTDFRLQITRAIQLRDELDDGAELAFEMALAAANLLESSPEIAESAQLVAARPGATALVYYAMGETARAHGAYRLSFGRSNPDSDDAIAKLEDQFARGQALHDLRILATIQDWPRYARLAALVIERFGQDFWASEPGQEPEHLAFMSAYFTHTNRAGDGFAFLDIAMSMLETRYARLDTGNSRLLHSFASGVNLVYGTAVAAAVRAWNADPGPVGPLAERVVDCAERGRARSLLDLLRSNTAAQASVDGSDVLKAWRALDARQALLYHKLSNQPDDREDLERDLEQVERELDSVQGRLTKELPTLAKTMRAATKPSRLEELRAALGPDRVLLAYSYDRRRLCAWMITDQGLSDCVEHSYEFGEVDRLVHEFWSACRAGGPSSAGERLTQLLLKPFAATLDHSPKLVISPYAELYRLPWPALPWRGRPLGDANTIEITPSASTYILAREGRRDGRALVVGNPAKMTCVKPDGEVQKLSALPGAEREAHDIAALYPQVRALIGPEATKAELLAAMGRASVIHLATHGWWNVDAPLESAVALAQGHALTVGEIMGLDLRGALVVLSACETGLTDRPRGQEFTGFARALLAAGARAVVLSLWEIPDQATSTFMVDFHQNLRAGLDPARAMLVARRRARGLPTLEGDKRSGTREIEPESEGANEQWAWAPFVLIC